MKNRANILLSLRAGALLLVFLGISTAQVEKNSLELQREIAQLIAKLESTGFGNHVPPVERRLVEIGEPAIPKLLVALKQYDDDKNTEKIYNDENMWLRSWAARILAQIGDETTIPAVIDSLKDKNVNVRNNNASSLARFGQKAVPHITEALKDKDPDAVFRLKLVDSLGDIEGKGSVLALLGQMAQESSSRHRNRIMDVLDAKNDSSMLPQLWKVAKEVKPEIRKDILKGLMDIYGKTTGKPQPVIWQGKYKAIIKEGFIVANGVILKKPYVVVFDPNRNVARVNDSEVRFMGTRSYIQRDGNYFPRTINEKNLTLGEKRAVKNIQNSWKRVKEFENELTSHYNYSLNTSQSDVDALRSLHDFLKQHFVTDYVITSAKPDSQHFKRLVITYPEDIEVAYGVGGDAAKKDMEKSFAGFCKSLGRGAFMLKSNGSGIGSRNGRGFEKVILQILGMDMPDKKKIEWLRDILRDEQWAAEIVALNKQTTRKLNPSREIEAPAQWPRMSWDTSRFQEFFHSADTVLLIFHGAYSDSKGDHPAETLVLKSKTEIGKLIADLTLVPKARSACDHFQMLVFKKGRAELKISICSHCFNILTVDGIKPFQMPKGLYQRFTALQTDDERSQKKTDAE